MAYTILKTDGQTLTTIADGTINTTSTSLGLPGRNYAGYGNILDTNFVHIMESFANTSPPPNPLQGQLWFNTNNSTLNICPADYTSNANAWLTLAQSGGTGTTTFGNLLVTGNITANNANIANALVSDTITVRLATVTANANIANATVTTGNIGVVNTANITTGGNTTTGNISGTWTLTGGGTANGIGGSGLIIQNGNLQVGYGNTLSPNLGIKTDNYYYANGVRVSFQGTYNNGNVYDYLTGSNSIAQFGGVIAPSSITTANITTGGNTTAGTITGNWSLTTGSRLLATYADLAERFEADQEYEVGTVVELGGTKEITAVKTDLSENVFGVVSNTAAYLMNGMAGSDKTHPAIALAGRVEVKAIGQVNKFDRLVSAGNGVARSAKAEELTAFNTIGRALADKTTDGVGLVLAIVTVK